MSYEYAASKLSTARRILMLPHPNGEAESIAMAFHEIHLGLMDIDRSKLDDSARGWARTLDEVMDTAGLEDNEKVGLWTVKARTLGVDDLIDLSMAVDELQFWFDRQNG
ncbi:hypothetical protein D9M71_798020 [compost metagenome]